MSEQNSYVQSRVQKDQALLEAIKANLPQLQSLLTVFLDEYQDGVYRFYHQSFKVYSLQEHTLKAIKIFKTIAESTNSQLNRSFDAIVASGTGVQFSLDHNKDWMLNTRPIVEAFLHTKYFLEMMVEVVGEMDSAQTILPGGWASILELYQQR